MAQPTLGELRFAQRLMATELRHRRRPASPLFRHTFDFAIVVTFLFFLLM